MMFYAGIGARATSKDVLYSMYDLAEELNEIGLITRSGGAEGPDTVCGNAHSPSKRKIYIPWDGFNGHNHNPENGYYLNDHKFTMPIAKRYEPRLSGYRHITKLFYSRNVSQIFGEPDEPLSSFVLCNTDKGMIVGGTGFALRMAIANNIKIFNYGSYGDHESLRRELLDYLIEMSESNNNK